MWIYQQKTGKLFRGDLYVATGYAGIGVGKNNPEMESVSQVGPLPRGFYVMETPRDTETHGPYVIPLTPDKANEMYGRSAFLCHGDSIKKPGTASHGCIIMPRWVRQQMWSSGDHKLQVVSGE